MEFDALLPENLSKADQQRVSGVANRLHVRIGSGGENMAGEFNRLDWPKRTALVCDNRTWPVWGQAIAAELSAAGYELTLINLGSGPKADEAHIRYIREAAAPAGALVGVGSGTIGDLCKYTAFLLDMPYAICGTAPSMNGYLSANAAITAGGHKKSLAARLPRAALFDLSILQNAPARLIRSGFGDALCRPTAQADWLLSHLLLDTAYDPLPFALLAPYEDGLRHGDMAALIKTLLLSGLGMTLAGGSHPASEGEHLIAHYMEMRHPELTGNTYHGEQIGVTTLYMARRQEACLANPLPPALRHPTVDESHCRERFGGETGYAVWREYAAKLERIGDIAARNRHLARHWQDIREAVARIHVTPRALEKTLENVEAPRTPEELGWEGEPWMEATGHAHLIRDRFTFLDLEPN